MIRPSAKDQIFLKELADITLANLGNVEFGVSDLARKAGMNRDKLCKRLQYLTNKTIKQFIREIRLRKAYELLRDEDLTASEVAYKVGFGSATYFNTCFTEFFGHPPGSVRKGEFVIDGEPYQIKADAENAQKRFLSRTVVRLFAGIIFIGIIIYLAYSNFYKPGADESALVSEKLEKSIAVIPFKNLSDSAGNQYFVDGIAEDILTLLSRVRDLRVVSRTSVEQFRNSKMSPEEIADRLKVNYIIEGSVQKSGNMFRLWIQLIDATTGRHLWAEAYDGKYSTDIFSFQNSIARKVASSLNVVMTPKEEQKINGNPTNEILAYDLSMKGQELSRKWDMSGDDQYLKLALNAYNSALIIDTNYVKALLGKALVLIRTGMYDSSMACFRKVLSLDNENADAMGGIGGYYLYTNNPDSALSYFQKSTDLNINNELCFWNYLGSAQVFFMYRNDVIEAFSYLQKAYDCGGYLWPEIHYTISLLYSSIGDYSKALKYMHTALSMSSNCNYIRSSFYILSARESYNEALEFIDSIRRITPCEQACDIMKFYLFTAQKKSDQAEMFLNKAIREGYKLGWDDYIYKSCLYKGTGRKSEDFLKIKQIVAREENVLQTRRSFWASETALRAAAGYAILGDNRKAMTYIKLLEKYGCNDNPFPLRSFPGFDNLRNDPEFEETVKRIEEKRDSIRAEVKMMEQQGEINL